MLKNRVRLVPKVYVNMNRLVKPIVKPIIRPIVSVPKFIRNPIIDINEIRKKNEEKQIENVGKSLELLNFPNFKKDEIISNERMIRIGEWIWSGSLDRFKIKSLNMRNIVGLSRAGILKKGDIISIRSNFLPDLYKCLNGLVEPIIIISNYSDKTIDNTFKYIADHPKIYHWYAINCLIDHPKITKIPLGLGAQHNSFGNLELISKLIIEKHDRPKRKILINYKIDKLRPVRHGLTNILNNQGFLNTYGMTIDKYWSAIIDHEFIISPPGCGIDCYRIWETLYLGRIPVVLDNVAFSSFKDLPILFVSDYNDLYSKLEIDLEWYKREFNWDKLRYQYWFNLIHNKKKECLGISEEPNIIIPPLIDEPINSIPLKPFSLE